MTTLYGIRTCDTIRTARAWLDAHGVAYAFHDYRTAGIDRAVLEGWADELGWEALLNRAGTTFRKLSQAERTDLNRDRAITLMLAHPSTIRRPVLDTGAARIVGFKAERYAEAFG